MGAERQMPAGAVTPSDQQGLAGGGGVPSSPTAGAEMRILGVGDAMQRLQASRVAMEIVERIERKGDMTEEVSEIAHDIELSAICVASEAISSLLPQEPQPLPGPSNVEPIDSNSRP